MINEDVLKDFEENGIQLDETHILLPKYNKESKEGTFLLATLGYKYEGDIVTTEKVLFRIEDVGDKYEFNGDIYKVNGQE